VKAAATAHVPPQNIEAEESVLGAMLVFPAMVPCVVDEVGLKAEDFYLEKHAAIFRCVQELYASAKPVDELSVTESLVQRNQIEEAGGKHYVSELAAKVPAAGNAKHYAEIVQQNSEMRRVGRGLQLASEAFIGRNGDAPEEIFQRVIALLEEAQPTASIGEPSSWHAEDLAEAIAGKGGGEPPTILPRADGPCLLYDGRLHQISAEPEAGKGWFACRAAADLLRVGCVVVYIDFEDTASAITERLQALGVEDARILEQLIYIRPHEPLTDLSRADLEAAFAREPALVVIDGVTEALTIHGFDLGDNADIARWLELLPRPAIRSGAAVLMIDHVVKDKESRGRYAIGAQHKLAGIDVAYALEVVEAFGRGKDGLVKVKVNKDRPGHVRPHSDGEQIALMRFSSDSESGRVVVSLDPPDSTDDAGEFRPTVLMERISRALEVKPGMSARDIRALGGKGAALDQALKLLIADGYVKVERDGSAHRHHTVRPYGRITLLEDAA
jgi:hypothetical protein